MFDKIEELLDLNVEEGRTNPWIIVLGRLVEYDPARTARRSRA